MQKILVAIALCTLVVCPLLVRADGAEESELPEPAVTATHAADQTCSAVTDFGLPRPQTAWGLPNCSVFQGKPCSSPGAWVRCQWQPGEPEICICQASLTWHCG